MWITSKRLTGVIFAGLILVNIFGCCSSRHPKAIPQTECDSLFFDLNSGMINNVAPTLSIEEIQGWFPCFTLTVQNGSSSNCGGGVLYKNHGFSYYTYFDYIEVSSKFKGNVTDNLLGASKEEVLKKLETPLKMETLEGADAYFYNAPYGCKVFWIQGEKVDKIGVYYNDCDNINLCGTQ